MEIFLEFELPLILHNLCVVEDQFVLMTILRDLFRSSMSGCQTSATGMECFLMMIKIVLFGYRVRVL